MSEPTPEVPATTAPEATTPPATQDETTLPQWARDAISKANREAAKYRTEAAELKPQAEQFRALEEASKSEAQRLAEAKDAAERRADDASALAVRYKAAATYGIPADHFDLLGSGTEEEITARAAKLQALLAAQAPAPTPPLPGRPVEQLRPGASPSETQSEDDVLYESLFGSAR